MTTLAPVISGADVLICCGSGGVGKTTTAAVIGLQAARHGRRVVVVTIDPARRLADALGVAGGLTGEPQRIDNPDGDATTRSGGAGAEAVSDASGEGELWAMMLDTPAMFAKVIASHAGGPEQVARITENRFYRNIADALSGTQEYMASEALHELHGDDRFDLVVVDTPPSRNALDFLDAPGVLARFLDHAVFKLMMAPTKTGLKVVSAISQPVLRAVGRVVGSDVLTDAVAFFQAFAGMETGFRDRAREVTALLHADTTRFVVVTAPQHESVAEATWFSDQLVDQGFAVSATVVNRVQPDFGKPAAEPDATPAGDDSMDVTDDRLTALVANLDELRAIAAAQHAELAPIRERVDRLVEVPLLSSDVHDLDGLHELGTHLFP